MIPIIPFRKNTPKTQYQSRIYIIVNHSILDSIFFYVVQMTYIERLTWVLCYLIDWYIDWYIDWASLTQTRIFMNISVFAVTFNCPPPPTSLIRIPFHGKNCPTHTRPTFFRGGGAFKRERGVSRIHPMLDTPLVASQIYRGWGRWNIHELSLAALHTQYTDV